MAERYDVALLDLDGVVYVGEQAVPGAPEALAAAAAAGMRLAFVTNNASRSPATVSEHLRRIGVPARDDDVVTSAQAAARVVAGLVPSGAAVLVVGAAGLVEAVEEQGMRPVYTTDDGPAAVVQGFGPDVGWRLLTEATHAVRTGLPWVATNLDRTVPTARGPAPGNGALVGLVAAAAGRPPDAVAGKPELALHREAVVRTAALHPLVVGDRLDTDIEGANRAETDSLLVLTGVTDLAGLLAAEPQHRPTYASAELHGLLRVHRAARPVPTGGWACGGWSVDAADQRLVVGGEGTADDLLQAACAAAWSAQPTAPAAADYAVQVQAALRTASAA